MLLKFLERRTRRQRAIDNFHHLVMTIFVQPTKMSAPRDFTSMEQAVTDLVTKVFESEGSEGQGAMQIDRLEQFVEHLTTVRELLTAAKNPRIAKSSRLEMINEAFSLVESTIKDLGEKMLTLSLKKLRFECVEEFIRVAEEPATALRGEGHERPGATDADS